MDLKNETYLGIGLVRNEDYIGLYFNLTAWNIMKPKNVIQLSLRWGVFLPRIYKIALNFQIDQCDIFQYRKLKSLVSLERGESALSYRSVSKKISRQKKFYGS